MPRLRSKGSDSPMGQLAGALSHTSWRATDGDGIAQGRAPSRPWMTVSVHRQPVHTLAPQYALPTRAHQPEVFAPDRFAGVAAGVPAAVGKQRLGGVPGRCGQLSPRLTRPTRTAAMAALALLWAPSFS
jgi:hypothetical protein